MKKLNLLPKRLNSDVCDGNTWYYCIKCPQVNLVLNPRCLCPTPTAIGRNPLGKAICKDCFGEIN